MNKQAVLIVAAGVAAWLVWLAIEKRRQVLGPTAAELQANRERLQRELANAAGFWI